MNLAQASVGQPVILWGEPPGKNGEDGNATKNYRRVVEGTSSYWEIQWRKQDRGEVRVPYESNKGQWSRKASQRPFGLLELSRGDKSPTNCYD